MTGTARRLALAVLAAALAGCSSSGGTPPLVAGGSGLDLGTATHDIVYSLTGSASRADITYEVGGDGERQQQGISVPMVNKSGGSGIQFEADDGAFLYFSAQNNGDGTLHCKIKEDGEVVSDNTSSGEFAIVTCQGSA